MSVNPFAHRFEDLPASLPVFPLTGVLLLPQGRLPLNVFEPRYLNMVRDALATDRLIGMIQPRKPSDPADAPEMYPLGCAGRITQFAETDDGRFMITLTGACRFRVDQEVTSMRGYRRVIADWSGYRTDLEPEPEITLDRERFDDSLRRYFDAQGITADWDTIRSTADDPLITTLAMICPFEPNEKQALLETPGLQERADMMLTLLEMAVVGESGGDYARH
jgi:hypothetical protein